jgi:hypothetical protein
MTRMSLIFYFYNIRRLYSSRSVAKALHRHSRMQLAGIQKPYRHNSLIGNLNARQKHSGMTAK